MGIREETEKKVFTYIEEYNMIAPGDRIVVGVSGGADSVCLLEMLCAYGRKVPLELSVVHVNHGLREDAEEDARYVEELCGRKHIPFFLTKADVHRVALEEKCSEEDAGRRIRYRAFGQAVMKIGGGKVAVAHNSNDNAETMLFHLFRGSGLKGLGGIAPVRMDEDGTCILRPLLCLERQEVEAYLQERQISWCTDSTNGGDGYSRNRIRHHILPYAVQEVSPGAVEHMLQAAKQLQETEGYLAEQTKEALERCMVVRRKGDMGAAEAGPYLLDIASFQGYHKALQSRMLLELMKGLSPTGKDISAIHVRQGLSLFEKPGNRSINLPYGIKARRQYGQVILERRETRGPGEEAVPEKPWQLNIEVPLTEALFQAPVLYELGSFGEMEFSAFFRKKAQELPQNQYTKWFDYDKMEERAVIRFRSRGDFFTIAGGGGRVVHKSLKDYMITEKIPRQIRDRIPVVAFGSHVLWLVGWRISQAFKVSEDTERILQVRFIKKMG